MSSDRSKPGTCVENGVRTTMENPIVKSVGKGTNSTIPAPFDAPHMVGNGGIPTHSMESLGQKEATRVAPALASPDKNAAAPNSERRYPAKK